MHDRNIKDNSDVTILEVSVVPHLKSFARKDSQELASLRRIIYLLRSNTISSHK